MKSITNITKKIWTWVKFSAFTFPLSVLVSCEQIEDFPQETDGDAVKINATIGKLQTRVSYYEEGGTAFDDGDQICVENTKRTTKNIATYYLNGSAWATDDALVWNGSSTNRFEAWYPVADYSSFRTFELPTDQSDKEMLSAADWMTASTDEMTKPEDRTLNLAFEHLLTKVTVNITKWNSEFSGVAQTISDPKIYTNGTAITATYSKDTETGKTVATIESDETLTPIDPVVDGQTFTAIITPAAYAASDNFMTFTVNNQSLTVLAKAAQLTTGLEAGKHYTFDLTVGKDAAIISSVSVTPWNTETIDGGVAEEVIIPYLTFTADAEQTLKVKLKGEYTLHESLQYSVGNGEWAQLTAGTEIPFGGDKGTLRMRGKSAGGMATDNTNYAQISFGNTSVPVACSGDIRTLVDYANHTTTGMSEARFSYMFYGCTNLTSAPELPATTLASGCYNGMFFYCSSLTSAPELPATTLASDCYKNMFDDCTSLTSAPELPATTLASGCYRNMFDDCTSLTSAPELPATTLASDCYNAMFYGCTSLTSAPELPATNLADLCYVNMFYGCTNLTSAPELPATTLADFCYYGMFYGCTNLNSVTMLATDISADSGLTEWLSGVASTGTFTKAASIDESAFSRDGSGIPEGWEVQDYVAPEQGN